MYDTNDTESEIERMLKDDIREQKRTGNGIHGRALRLRKHETVRTPSESLQGIERLKIYAPSVIHSITIGEMKMNELLEKINLGEIPPKQEFEALDFDNCQKSLAELRRLHTNHEIMKSWKCSSTSLSSFFAEMQVAKIKGGEILIGKSAVDFLNKGRITRGLPKIGEDNNKEKIKRPYNRHVSVDNSKEILSENIIPTQNVDSISIQQTQQKEIVIDNNYLINVKRKFNTRNLASFLERLTLFLSEDDQEFLVEIKVTEVESKK